MAEKNRYGVVSVGKFIPAQYRFHLHRDASASFKEIDVYGYLPESLEFALEASYSTPLGDLAGKAIPDGIGASVYSMFGGTFTNRLLSTKFWAGSATGAQSIAFDLIAETDPVTEIREVLQTLYSLVMPIEKVDGGLFMSPGASFSAAKFFSAGKEAVKGVIDNINAAKTAPASTPASTPASAPNGTPAAPTANVNGQTPITDATTGKPITTPSSGIVDTVKQMAGKAAEAAKNAFNSGKDQVSKLMDPNVTPSAPAAIAAGAADLAQSAAGAVVNAQGAMDTGIGKFSNSIESFLEGKISIELGLHQVFRNVVITGISHTDPVRPDEDGYMLKSTVIIRFEPMQTLTSRNIPELLPIYRPPAASNTTPVNADF